MKTLSKYEARNTARAFGLSLPDASPVGMPPLIKYPPESDAEKPTWLRSFNE